MAARQFSARNYFLALVALLAVMYGLVFFTGSSRTPTLGLDLQGGTTVTLTAKTADDKPPSATDLDLARSIIEQRVDGLGVAEAEVVTEGDSNIVISVPGDDGNQARELGQTAQLRFRPVLQSAAAGAAAATTDPAAPTTDPAAPTTDPAAPTTDPAAPTTDPAAPTTDAPSSASPQGFRRADPTTAPVITTPATPATPTDGAVTDDAVDPDAPAVTPEQAAASYATLSCAAGATTTQPDRPEDNVAVCSTDGAAKYLLGPSVLEGTQVTSASAGTETTTGAWVVNLNLDGSGSDAWAQYTSANVGKQVGIVLDQKVVSAPTINGAINGGSTQITGNFSQTEAETLANQLKYGSLPLTFIQATAQSISTELGSEQLRAGLLAGGLGILLVFVYGLLYYRGLGLVMIASLVLSGLVVYGSLVLLGRQIGFALSLAGIAGFIVSIGITADSFVVYFERLKDEIREGRTLRSAVPRAWVRARRTILSADAVSFLAAAILYWLAIGDVKGFAFTLGLSTVLDLVVVFLFTHPLMAVLSRYKGFGSNRFSGLGQVDRTRRAPGTSSPGSAGRELVGAGSTRPSAGRSTSNRSTR